MINMYQMVISWNEKKKILEIFFKGMISTQIWRCV